jgi:2-iminobutanoate/2-iminopropanoate deaminase
MKYILFDEKDAKKKAHYSPAVEHNNIIYVSGQLPLIDAMKKPPSEDIKEQTKIVLQKLQKILQKAGSTINNVLQVTIFVTDISHWDKVNEVYAHFFGEHRPARTIVPTNALHYNCLIELNAIAFR